MRDVPDDVLQAAARLAQGFASSSNYDAGTVMEIAAAAILEERKRCAAIARAYPVGRDIEIGAPPQAVGRFEGEQVASAVIAQRILGSASEKRGSSLHS